MFYGFNVSRWWFVTVVIRGFMVSLCVSGIFATPIHFYLKRFYYYLIDCLFSVAVLFSYRSRVLNLITFIGVYSLVYSVISWVVSFYHGFMGFISSRSVGLSGVG